jgi:hypothetical protein
VRRAPPHGDARSATALGWILAIAARFAHRPIISSEGRQASEGRTKPTWRLYSTHPIPLVCLPICLQH